MAPVLLRTPTIAVGDLHPHVYDEIECVSSPNSTATNSKPYDPLGIRKKKLNQNKIARHVARALVWEGRKAAKKRRFRMKTATAGIAKGGRPMKWHSASKARKAVQAVKDIDPGIGWKIQVVRDKTAKPPPIPPTPPPIGDDDGADDESTGCSFTLPVQYESQATVLSKENWFTCLGCEKTTCPHKKRMAVAASHVEGTEGLLEHWKLSQKHEWFCEIYRQVVPNLTFKDKHALEDLTKDEINTGIECAKKYARETWTDWFAQWGSPPDSIGSIAEE